MGDEATRAHRHRFALAGLTVSLAIPYAVFGPGFIVDDFFTLREAAIDGWYMAAGSDQWRARPGAGVVYAVVFGIVGDRPLLVFTLQLLLVVIATVLLFELLRDRFSLRIAVAVTAVWAVQPNHSSLEMWASVTNVVVALILVLSAFLLLTRFPPSTPLDLVAVGLLVVAVLSYEAVAPVAGAGALALAFIERTGRARWRLAISASFGLAVAGLWMILNWHPEKDQIDVWIDPAAVLRGHLTTSLYGTDQVGTVAGLVTLAAVAIALGLRLMRSSFCDPRSARLLGGGAALMSLGALPFVRYFYSPIGFGDRVTVVSGIGGAMILVATALEWGSFLPRPPVFLAVALLGLGAILWRVELAQTYSTAAGDGRRLLSEVERRFPEPPAEPIVVGPYPVLENNVGAALQFDWPIQWHYRDRSVQVITTYRTSDFESYDRGQRIDLLRLTKLDPDVDPDRAEAAG